MRIAVIGAGRVGTALGERWRAGGHDVVYGVRDPGDPRHGDRPTATPPDAVTGAEVVVVSLPWAATEAVLTGLSVGGAVVVDATNPLAAGARELVRAPGLSGAQLVARWTGSPRVVKAFNTTGSQNLADPDYPGGPPAMLVAGDDDEAKATTMALAAEVGFEAVDAGGLDAAGDLEHLAMIWIRLAYPMGNGPDFAFGIVRR